MEPKIEGIERYCGIQLIRNGNRKFIQKIQTEPGWKPGIEVSQKTKETKPFQFFQEE